MWLCTLAHLQPTGSSCMKNVVFNSWRKNNCHVNAGQSNSQRVSMRAHAHTQLTCSFLADAPLNASHFHSLDVTTSSDSEETFASYAVRSRSLEIAKQKHPI